MPDVATSQTPVPPVRTPPTPNRLATASLLLSLAGSLIFITTIPGILLGLMARAQIKRSEGRQSGESVAFWGIVIGIVIFLVWVGLGIATLFAIHHCRKVGDCSQTANN